MDIKRSKFNDIFGLSGTTTLPKEIKVNYRTHINYSEGQAYVENKDISLPVDQLYKLVSSKEIDSIEIGSDVTTIIATDYFNSLFDVLEEYSEYRETEDIINKEIDADQLLLNFNEKD